MKIIPFLILWTTLQVSPGFPLQEGNGNAPFMIDKTIGWKLVYTDTAITLLRTTDGGKHWIGVSPLALAAAAKNQDDVTSFEDVTALCPLDAQRAWMAVILKNRVMLEFTSSAGRHWRESIGPVAMQSVAISFLNEQNGFILNSSDPAAGLMKKEVYGTQDGGRHWAPLTSPNLKNTRYYTTGITFRSPQVGWVTGTYYGVPDAPFFRTEDGGKIWDQQKLTFPPDYQGGYADTYPPVFPGADKKRGYLPVKLVRHDPQPGHYAWVNYETDDGGVTWRVPASDVQSKPDN